MDFESPDVEKDFPGLYASETGRKSNESDFSDGGEHDKPSKKDLLGRRKDKKDSKKDRGYAALEGESSPEEDTDTKSPSKSKKTKSFKFPSKSKEKREKSRDKEKVVEDVSKHKELNEKEKKKEKEREKEREKEKKEKEKRDKLREKDKEKEEKAKFKLESKEKLKDDKKDKVKDKERDKVKDRDREKVKEKDKERKEKKLTKVPSTVTSGVPFEEIFTLGVALPIFGVPLQQSVDRSRCHDDSGLPLVVRDAIDFLQANGLKSGDLYRTEADKIKLQQLRKLYTDRGVTFPYHWDVPVACAMLKSFLSELPESVLSQELHGQFEQAAAIAEPQREAATVKLLNRLPSCNLSLLGWLVRHFQGVLAHEQTNHVSLQALCAFVCPALGVSHTLLAYLVSRADALFPDTRLAKYVPPLLSIPADFPESAGEICSELRKQESLLSQLHAEMHAGFISPARDQQLWEAQTILTQLKRKLRLVQKSVEPTSLPSQQQSVEEKPEETRPPIEQPEEQVKREEEPSTELTDGKEPSAVPDEKQSQELAFPVDFDSQAAEFPVEFEDNFEFQAKASEIDAEKPKLTEKELRVLRLQLENAEYLQLKSLLQAKINSEQFEIVKLRSHVALKNKQEGQREKESGQEDAELKQRLLKENAALEQKRLTLVHQIFQERVACVQLKIELAMKEVMSKS